MLDLFRVVFTPPRDLILVVLASWLGLALAETRAVRYAVPVQNVTNLIFYGVLSYILGGRLFYAVENLPAFTRSPVSLISLNVGLFDPWGALVTAILVCLVIGQRQKLSLWPALDALTPFLACIAVGLALSHLASGLAFGAETNLPWGIFLWGANRQPTQIYEIIASLLILGLIWFYRIGGRPGTTFLIFSACTSASRLIIEGFRGDSTLILNGLRLAQLIAWIVLGISLVLLERFGFLAAPQEDLLEGNKPAFSTIKRSSTRRKPLSAPGKKQVQKGKRSRSAAK